MKSKIVLRVALALAMALGELSFCSGSASAAPSCGSGYLCLYDTTSGGTQLSSTLATAYTRSVCYALTPAENNRVGYVVNDSAYTFVVYDNSTCSGTYSFWYAHTSGAMNSQWNNAVSSMYRS